LPTIQSILDEGKKIQVLAEIEVPPHHRLKNRYIELRTGIREHDISIFETRNTLG